MKRITQILASVLFVITVLTIYLAFDFAINNAVANKNPSRKRPIPEHDHYHRHDNLHDEIKITKKRSLSTIILPHIRKSNHTIKHHNDNEHHVLNNERLTNNDKQRQVRIRPKPGSFPKSKTGVKLNKPQKSVKEQGKRLSTATTKSHHKDKRHIDDKKHV